MQLKIHFLGDVVDLLQTFSGKAASEENYINFDVVPYADMADVIITGEVGMAQHFLEFDDDTLRVVMCCTEKNELFSKDWNGRLIWCAESENIDNLRDLLANLNT